MPKTDDPLGRAGPVLVVDDDPVLLEFICLALTEQGYRTAGASNGVQALAMSAELCPALVLMDVGMPLLGGGELAGRIHELAGTAIPCVIMSGSRPAPEVLEADAVSGYLAKPFDIDDLFDVVRKYAGVPERTAAG